MYSHKNETIDDITSKNITSDIKLVFNSSTITMMRGPINIRRLVMCTRLEVSNMCVTGRQAMKVEESSVTL